MTFLLYLLVVSIFSGLPLGSPLTNAPELHPIEGYWKGELTHPGGYRDAYTFTLQLQKKGENFTGWSKVSTDNINAEMVMSGTVFQNSLLILEDKELLQHKINPGMEWCMKRYQLMLIKVGDQYRLEGDWQGDTSFGACDPGKVILTKRVPRA